MRRVRRVATGCEIGDAWGLKPMRFPRIQGLDESRLNLYCDKPPRWPQVFNPSCPRRVVDEHGTTILQLKKLVSVGLPSREESGQTLQESDNAVQ